MMKLDPKLMPKLAKKKRKREQEREVAAGWSNPKAWKNVDGGTKNKKP